MNAVVAYVGLGSNLDVPAQQIASALVDLAGIPDTRVLRHSRFYRTSPWGVTAQPDFVNAVAELETLNAGASALGHLLAIERKHGRERDQSRWGPRIIDLDLLLYGSERINERGLHVPHPHMHERAFVLVPLAELDPALGIPGHGRVDVLAAAITGASCVAL